MQTFLRSTVIILACACGTVAAAESPLADLPRHVQLDERRHASGQPSAQDIAGLPAAGVTTVIDLRPDAETPELDEQSLAAKAGLNYRPLPIAGAADLTRENVRRFDALTKDLPPGKVLIHCASGNRVGAMLALQARWQQGRSAEESLAIGKAAGLTSLTEDVKRLLDEPPRQSPAP